MDTQPLLLTTSVLDHKKRAVAQLLTFANTHATPGLEDISALLQNVLSKPDGNHVRWLLGVQQVILQICQSDYARLPQPYQTLEKIIWLIQPDDSLSQQAQAEFFAALKDHGIRFALAWQPEQVACYASWAEYWLIAADVFDALTAEQRKQLLQESTRLIITDLEDPSQHSRLEACGAMLFSGPYLLKQPMVPTKVINPGFDSVLHLLNLVSQDADQRTLENGFKRDTTLSYKLLRYINSVGFGLSCEVQSLKHALTILGRQQLYRWLTLLMVTAGNNAVSPALMRASILRGRVTELLGEPYLDKKERDNLFVVGVFSMLDIILGQPMTMALEKVQLAENVQDALLHQRGIYAPFLTLTLACEQGQTKQISALQESMALPTGLISQAQLNALLWTEALGI